MDCSNALNNGQAEAATRLFRLIAALKGLEQPGALIRRNAGPGVADLYDSGLPLHAACEPNLAAAGAVTDGIVHQIA